MRGLCFLVLIAFLLLTRLHLVNCQLLLIVDEVAVAGALAHLHVVTGDLGPLHLLVTVRQGRKHNITRRLSLVVLGLVLLFAEK